MIELKLFVMILVEKKMQTYKLPLRGLVSIYSLSRVFNLNIGTVLNCETIVRKCIEWNNKYGLICLNPT